ncbi:hypothetical protein RclHR1_12220004 [Rhizophagus clarus]|uniref:Uncharacterized protein n=1 Tax=Rhizophagus clarus TaxID=94130 RepID=A0A2Z6QLY9_9GLOM|nr:hypothetical protein RclHR1_12220004 [Rhizophagus clarus]GES92710.1 hypothetical protein GLOIN_2v1790551 [Rhizophagus clarus]
MEYYELSKLGETVPSKKQNLFAPKLPFRLGVAGTSESGKTKMVVHQLLGSKYPKVYPWMSGEKRDHKIPKGGSKNFGERYIPCDNLIVVMQHQDEELWETVQCFYEFIAKDKQAPWYKNVRFKLIAPEELSDIVSFKRTGRSTVIVFDDLAREPLAT